MVRPSDHPSRDSLLERLKQQGIHDVRILNAIARVPRERFVPPDERGRSHEDRALPIGLKQTISQPFIVALMTLELALTGIERVLEIGTGSGYQTALLAELAKEVFTVERHSTLSLRSRGILDGLSYTNIHYRVGDGSLGWKAEAPFHRILLTAGAPTLPAALFDQLSEGGLLVAPLGGEGNQKITVVRKQQNKPTFREVLSCRFVPLIGVQGWPEKDG
jgi:protein-L-isoaspartate(D-aspartate) O-methyltransferase